ncbi:MAG: carbamoyltransferase HypF [Rhodospirillales bacterium]|nr:carbamoyltransferase HypF [Rhodospirillales bacterium]
MTAAFAAASDIAARRPPVVCRLRIGGRVQGVGFRPFVQRLAMRLALDGWVKNHAGEVHIVVAGRGPAVAAFTAAVIAEAPPLARPRLICRETPGDGAGAVEPGFRILASSDGDASHAHLPPDQYACADCLAELRDPASRRYRYPFINCTQCGPRYTIIRRLPYDRPHTTMAGFALCADCAREYADPTDRRFHAEPLACPACGPQLSFRAADGAATIEGSEPALAAARAALRQGLIVAVRGIGGYHLLCDAGDEAAVRRLRQRKHRPQKPLAVMVRPLGADGLDEARRLADLDPLAAAMLADPLRPIVLAARRAGSPLAAAIAPGLAEVGLMLPYSPLHTLLTEDFGGPLVATSGNISGEPVLTEPAEAEARLGAIADAFLHHDRPIVRPADDPVYRVIAGAARPLRLGRGNAPHAVALPGRLARPTLAVGGHLKATVALAWDDRAVLSPHIGDLGSPRSLEVFEAVIADLQRLYGVAAERIVCDAHPGYASTRWARRLGLPLRTVLHHHAHASALAGEYGLAAARTAPMLVFAWDGVGYGADGGLWGGETFLGVPGSWRRVAHLRPFRLPGGDQAARQPWRSAVAVAWTAGIEPPAHLWPSGGADADVLRHAWTRGLNVAATTAAGRLFDAAAALTGIARTASFEGEAPMRLEAVSANTDEAVSLPLTGGNDGAPLIVDWAPLLPMLTDESRSAAARGGIFHASLARAIGDVARHLRAGTGITSVGLTGGVFQNRLLAERAAGELAKAGCEVLLAREIPCNDAGISFGQIIEALAADGDRR